MSTAEAEGGGEQAAAAERAHWRPRRGAWRAWGMAVAAYFVAVFHRMSLGVASLDAERRFHIGPSTLATFIAVQLGIYALMQMPTGAMADRFGPRRILTAALALMAAGEILFGTAGGAGAALAGRALVGLGDALTFLNVLRVAQNWFPPSRYGMLASLTALVGGLGQLVSTVPLRAGLSTFGWSPTFLGAAALTAFAAVVVRQLLADRPVVRAVPGGPAPGGSSRGLSSAVRAVMRSPGTWRAMWAHFTLTGPFVVFTALWGYPYLVRGEHYSAAAASTALAGVVVAAVVTAPVVGAVLLRAPRYRPAVVWASGGSLLAAWLLVLGLGPGHDPAPVVGFLLAATGLASSASAVAFDLAREANPPERGGAATGVANIGGFVGAVVVDLAIGWLLATVGHGARSAGGFRVALAVMPAMVGFGLLQFWRAGRRHPAAPPGPGVGPGAPAVGQVDAIVPRPPC